MMYHERYADLSSVTDPENTDRATAITDFWEICHDMGNIVQTLPKGEEMGRFEGSMRTIQWIANIDGHFSLRCLGKLWEELEGKTRIPKRLAFNREEQLRSNREYVAHLEARELEAAKNRIAESLKD